MAGEEGNSCVEEKDTDHQAMEVRKPGKGDAQDNNDASFKKLVNAAVLVVLVALIFIALFSFFFNMQEAIIALFHPRYQALMQAIFSLVVLVIGIYIIRLLLPNKR
ncbi:hypothetical protein EO95_07345 [Methanosarcina sp. 1.H.T.1A.1]|uniref:hypothetical protein n=1 Tax=Methanosarcina sp. 1.H.T.1A.1 TaxID=1483602 RepID=UPI000621DDC7|nr:hypothetical protein [Methanosarcina sp. 1.H.T.1A.1]KKI00116.1 hypothetical protein EO95_07345 [Methanosarcina sp. 1.H.T.1A.1]